MNYMLMFCGYSFSKVGFGDVKMKRVALIEMIRH